MRRIRRAERLPDTIMALPTVLSQVIILAYNLADTYFIGTTNNPYMIGATSLVLALYLMLVVIANLFGVGGGNLMVRLLGQKDIEEAKKKMIAEEKAAEPEEQKMWVGFKVNISKSQAARLKAFFIENGIDFRPLKISEE